MTRVLVLGGGGMLGHKMFQILGRRFPATWCTLRCKDDPRLAPVDIFQGSNVVTGVDVLDRPALQGLIDELQPSVIVNCVGIIKQRHEAEDCKLSLEINSLLPHHLAVMAHKIGGRLIHFSTDCVFSGKQGRYSENSLSDALDVYGKTKYLGEVQAANALTLRTSIIGHELKNFASLLDWFLAQGGRSISGYRRVLYSGVTTNFLARTVGDLIENHLHLAGLFQVTSQTISKYELLCKVRDAYNLDVVINPEDDTVSDRSMVGDRFMATTGIETPSWDELIAELADEFPVYKSWRNS